MRNKVNYRELAGLLCYTSSVEPSKVDEALKDEYWIAAMQDELNQFTRNEVWTLV